MIDVNGPRCQGNCPNHGCVEALASGTALGRDGPLAAAERTRTRRSDAPLAADGEVDGRAVTEAALAGDGIAVGVVAGDRPPARRRPGELRQHLRARRDRRRRRRDRGGRAAARSRRAAELRARALPPMNETPVAWRPLGPDAGMIGAAAMASRGSRASGGASRVETRDADREGRLMPGRLTVCPTPIGNLDDLSPRARQALEDADLVACEDTRRTGLLYERLELRRPRLVSYHEGNEAERARQLVAADRARREGRAGLRRRHAGDLRPRLPPDPRLHRARPRGRGAARARRR